MNSVYRKMRLVTIGVVAAASIVAGMIAVWHLAPRDVMDGTPTWVYLGILALVLCPILTIAAWAWDRRAAQHEAHVSEAQKTESATMPFSAAVVQPPALKEVTSKPGRAATRRARPGNRHRTIRHAAK